MMGVPFLTEIFKRRIESDEIIAWKTVITMHKVFQEGHRKVNFCFILLLFIKFFFLFDFRL